MVVEQGESVETLEPQAEIIHTNDSTGIISPDDIELVRLPDDLKNLDPIKDQEQFVQVLVNKWNEIVALMENQTILFGKMVMKALEGHEDKTITEIVHKIKEHPDLRLTISKDRIWQGVRLIKARPDVVSAPTVNLDEDPKVYRKKDGTKNYEFYFELYKYNIPEGMRAYFEYEGKEQNWSVRELRENIRDYREDKLTPQEKLRYEKRDHIKVIVKQCRSMHPDGVKNVMQACKEIYDEYKYEQEKR